MNRFLPFAVAFVLFISLISGAIALIGLHEQSAQNNEIKQGARQALEFQAQNVESNCIVIKLQVTELTEKSRTKRSDASTAKRVKPFQTALASCEHELKEARAALPKTLP